MNFSNFLLSSIELQGYKGFQNSAKILINDLTLIYGENSAGKSSIMRLLASIAKAVLERSRYPLLPVSIDLSDQNFSSLFTNGLSTSLRLSLEFKKCESDESLKLGYSIQYIREKNSALITDFSIEQTEKAKWTFEIDTDYEASLNFEQKYFASHGEKKIDASLKFDFFGLAPTINESKGCEDKLYMTLHSAINAANRAISNFAESVVWIGPLRHIPARQSTLTCFPKAFSVDGRETLQLLHPSNPMGNKIATECSSWFKAATSRTLSVTQSVENNTEVFSVSLAPIEAPAMIIPITEHGAGMSQVLPIVILCGAASVQHPMWKVPPLLIFENPELHLHDGVHEKLANLFLDTAGNKGVRIIAETHSENVLLTMQISELERTNNVLRTISVNWVRKGDDGFSEVSQFKFNKNGSLGGLWSKSIFGHTPELVRRVMMLKIQKKTSGDANAD